MRSNVGIINTAAPYDARSVTSVRFFFSIHVSRNFSRHASDMTADHVKRPTVETVLVAL